MASIIPFMRCRVKKRLPTPFFSRPLFFPRLYSIALMKDQSLPEDVMQAPKAELLDRLARDDDSYVSRFAKETGGGNRANARARYLRAREKTAEDHGQGEIN